MEENITTGSVAAVDGDMGNCVQCGTNNSWRLKLRGSVGVPVQDGEEDEQKGMSCGHVVCIYCALIYVKAWIVSRRKAQIKCPVFECPDFIHENDIRALLDPENKELDKFMPNKERKQLLQRHDLHNVNFAFSGDDTTLKIKQCPRCKNIYHEKIGCKFVRCADLYCNTWFCWDCGETEVNCMHFTCGTCKPPLWEDVMKMLYVVTFLISVGGFTALYISPSIFLGIFVVCPLYITFVAPIHLLSWFKRQWIQRGRVRHGNPEMHFAIKYLLIGIGIVLYICMLPISSTMATIALIPLLFVWLIYLLLLFLKMIPIFGQIMCILDLLQWITSWCGYSDWFNDYRKARERKEKELIKDRQFRTDWRASCPGPAALKLGEF